MASIAQKLSLFQQLIFEGILLLGLIEACYSGRLWRLFLLKLIFELFCRVEIVVSFDIWVVLVKTRSPILFYQLVVAILVEHLGRILDSYDLIFVYRLGCQQIPQDQIIGWWELRNLLELVDVVPEGGHVARRLHLLMLLNLSMIPYVLLSSSIASVRKVVDEGVLVEVGISRLNIFYV